MKYLVKVTSKRKEYFVFVPKILYENALYEKKKCQNLDNYVRHYKRGRLVELQKLYNFIEETLDFEIDIEIERINTHGNLD